MKIYNKTLKKAYNLLRSGQNGKVISLLEPKVPLFLENYHFYYILGVACLRNGDTGGADTYLKRAVQVNRKMLEPRLFLAALSLKKRDTTEAVRLWLGILDIDPGCHQAKKGLEKIRKISDPEALDAYLNKGRFNAFIPKIRPNWGPRLIIPLLILALGYGLFSTRDLIISWSPWANEKPSRENLSHLMKDLKNEIISSADPQGFIYNLSDDQILSTLTTAQSFFDDYRDNEAQKEINRIIYSNAAESAKQKARILEGYLKEPDFTNFENIYDYKELASDPYLYNHCYIRWKGRFSNLTMTDPGMQFDFLVGYETAQVLEGIVPVYTEFQARLDSSLPIEILGRIEVMDQQRFRIKGTSIRNIVEP